MTIRANHPTTAPGPRDAVRRRRVLVLSAAVVVLGLKLWVAATTFGTFDVRHWESFAAAVRKVGPINIYALPSRALGILYNHPPLIGWMLLVMNHLVEPGISFPFLIRLPASVADVVTSLLIFEMLRARRSLREATAAALLVACSPVLFIISGFHGNTDPVFVMFTLLSAYLLINRPWPALPWVSAALAGAAFAVALSVKIVPIVVLPTLLLIAARRGRRKLASFVVGSGVILLPLWGPVVLGQWQPFRKDVLSYAGISTRQWGPVEFANVLHAPASAIMFIDRPGRFLDVLLSALLPALLLTGAGTRSCQRSACPSRCSSCSARPSAPSTWRGRLLPRISSNCGQPPPTTWLPERSWPRSTTGREATGLGTSFSPGGPCGPRRSQR